MRMPISRVRRVPQKTSRGRDKPKVPERAARRRSVVSERLTWPSRVRNERIGGRGSFWRTRRRTEAIAVVSPGKFGHAFASCQAESMRITLDVPDELAATLAPQGQDPTRATLEALALEACRQRRLLATSSVCIRSMTTRSTTSKRTWPAFGSFGKRQKPTARHDRYRRHGLLNYLVLIRAVDVLQPLYTRVIVPVAWRSSFGATSSVTNRKRRLPLLPRQPLF